MHQLYVLIFSHLELIYRRGVAQLLLPWAPAMGYTVSATGQPLTFC
jgi:hypothetical protein